MSKKNLEKIYEKCLEDVKPTDEMKELYDELSDKLIDIKNHLSDEDVKKIEELEDIFSRINDLETKSAFYKGFSVATNIMLEAKEE